jgi:TPR repeat protein
LRDELLFKQPESSYVGDCLICFLPLSNDEEKILSMSCCSKITCDGCIYANRLHDAKESLEPECPSCRHPIPNSQEEAKRNLMKRAEVNDPLAMMKMGTHLYKKEVYTSAFQYLTKAAELGDAKALFRLAAIYDKGHGVEEDVEKSIYHF